MVITANGNKLIYVVTIIQMHYVYRVRLIYYKLDKHYIKIFTKIQKSLKVLLFVCLFDIYNDDEAKTNT